MSQRGPRVLTDRVRELVDEGATAAEEMHKAAAGLPLDALERLDLLQGAVRGVRRIQDRSIEAVYDLVRGINREVTELAATILEGPAPAAPRRRPRRTSRKRKAA